MKKLKVIDLKNIFIIVPYLFGHKMIRLPNKILVLGGLENYSLLGNI
jgi:hypothetical protein